MKNLTTEEKFEQVCTLIETSEIGVLKACGIMQLGYETLLKLMKNNESLQIRYAHAKEQQIEALIDKISTLQEECLNEIRTIEDPKRVNAIQNAYKEQIRHIEWIASKLKPKTYGDRVDLTTNGESLTREIIITPILNTTQITTTSKPL